MSNKSFEIGSSLSFKPLSSAPSDPRDGEIYYDDNTNQLLVFTAGSFQPFGSGSGSPVVFRSIGTPTGTINGSFNVIVYPTADFDSNSAYNNVTGEYTAPFTGYYFVEAAVRFQGNSTANAQGDIAIYQNGSRVTYGQLQLGTNTVIYSHISIILSCTSGDTISIYGDSNLNSPIYSVGDLNHFSIHKIN